MLTTDLHACIRRSWVDLYLYFILLILVKQANYFERFTMSLTITDFFADAQATEHCCRRGRHPH
jgi:hypothetical protein